MRRDVILLVCVLGPALGCSGPALSQEVGFRGWIALVEPSHVGWLENENRLSELCESAANLAECYREYLAPAVIIYGLRAFPDPSSERLGDLVVTAVPGRGLTAHYRPAGAAQATAFTPDIFLQDWGYGPPYFHQTVMDSRDGWYELPAGPWSTAVWFNGGAAEGLSELRLHPGDIILLNDESFYVLETTERSLTVRPEQDADLWCEEGTPPLLKPATPTVYEWDDLVDERGHLVVRPKYMKGC